MKTFILILLLHNEQFAQLENVNLTYAECAKLGVEWMHWIGLEGHGDASQYSFDCLRVDTL